MRGAEAIDVMKIGAHDGWAERLNFDAAAILLSCGLSRSCSLKKGMHAGCIAQGMEWQMTPLTVAQDCVSSVRCGE